MPIHERKNSKKKRIESKPQKKPDIEDFQQNSAWWPLIPAAPVILAVVLALLPKPADINERKVARDSCIRNLYTIIALKDQYAKAHKIPKGTSASYELITSLQKFTICPDGGTIDIREIGREPRCSRHGLVSEWEEQRKSMAIWHDITTSIE